MANTSTLRDPITAYEWQKPGAVFVEWNTARDGSGTSYEIGDKPVNETYGLYAIWEAVDVVIDYNGTQIASMTASGTATLATSNKYCRGNITVAYTKPPSPTSVPTSTIESILSGTYVPTN